MNNKKILFFLLFLLWIFPLKLQAQNNTVITITPQNFSKILVRIPPFEGEKEEELSSLIRKLLNYHLIFVALKESPLKGFKEKSYYLKGKLKKGGTILFEGELIDTFEEKSLKRYQVSSSSLERLAYALTDQIINDISPYKGISQSRIVFIKRNEEGDHLYLMDFSKRNLKKIRSATLILFPKFSPSGRKIAYLVYEEKDYSLEIYDILTGTNESFHINSLSSAPIWDRDEKHLFLTLGKEGDINIYKFSLDNQSLIPITTGRGVHQAGSLSPDGRYLSYVGDKTGSPQIYLLDLNSNFTQRISFEGKYHTSPRFSPKGNFLIYLSSQGKKNQLVVYNLKTKEKKKYPLPDLSITDPSFSPTGDYLIFKALGRQQKGLFILHLDSLLYYIYLPYGNLYFPDWGKLYLGGAS
ncbi:MAG: hypothetical protein ACPLWD_07710 [Caldimicrobium thiodismutans]